MKSKSQTNTIWTYWEDIPGKETPPHIILCRKILKYKCQECNINIVTPNNVHEFLTDIPSNVWKISMESPKHNPIAVRCAFIRAFLLEKHGGLYVDADCIALKDFINILNILNAYDFVAMRRTSAKTKHISIGLLASKKNGRIISEYAEQLRSIINKKSTFRWAEVGAHLLTPIVNQVSNSVYLFREDQIHPVVAEKQYKFCDSTLEPFEVVPSDALCFMLYHRIFETYVQETTLKNCKIYDLYNDNMLISKVFRMACPASILNNQPPHATSSHSVKVDQSNTPFINIQRDSDKILTLTNYWSPPVPAWKPLKKSLNSSLRIAGVFEDRLYQGLRYEGEVMLLIPHNWKQTLTYGKPDFLLMESIWNTATGHWHMGQCPPAPDRDTLLEMVSLAQKKKIPTVFWFTKGHEYHEHYKDFAKHFDYVFCADPREIELLKKESIEAELLLPCVQPALYNPFRHYDAYSSLSLDILFEGWADLDRMGDDLSVIKQLKPYDLSVTEPRYQIFRRRVDVLPEYKDNIRGCSTERTRSLYLKYAGIYVTHANSISLKTTKQWLTLEAAAARLPIVHHGSVPDNDVRKGVIVECPDQNEFLSELVRCREDELYRERVAHLGWRKTLQEHTFSHRIRTICNKLGSNHDWEEYPKASLITPTFRRDMLTRCLKTYQQQTYPNKELIVVFNGKDVPSYSELGLSESQENIKITNVPGEMFAGACLNQGHNLADGTYCFRVDDDDFYGTNYILDMILLARSVDADFFGKPPAPIFFEDDQKVYVRKTEHPLSIVSKSLLESGRQWVGGNSIAGKKGFFASNNYEECAFGAADTNLLFKIMEKDSIICCLMDPFNLVAERRNDKGTHTWKIKDENIKKNSSLVYSDINSTFF